MPGIRKPNKRGIGEVEDGEDANLSRASSSSVDSPSGSRRVRLDQAGRSVSPQNPVLPDSYRSASRATGTSNGVHNAPLKHQPGSIVRVSLTNFVTYTNAVFHPGPSLNMVIGPNGTGKSTLVCAICLGLGWGTQHLGRAKDISEFVRYGSREAEIEIELAADPARHGQNPVIRRHIKREGNKTTWFLDGRSCTHKTVQELTRSFSIQVDNLCQFLPQDRVVEFAALSPVDLLAQTQKAAAPEHVTEWHEELKRLRREQKKSQAEHATLNESLTNLEARQNGQRGDVERLRERANMIERVAALERFRPFPLYSVARLQNQESKAQKLAAQKVLKALRKEVEPSLRAITEKKTYSDRVEKVVAQRKRLVERSDGEVDGALKKQNAVQEKIDDMNKEIEAEKNNAKKHKQEIPRIQGNINQLRRQLDEEPPVCDTAMYNERIREKQRLYRDIEMRDAEVRQEMEQLKGQAKSRNDRLVEARRELADLRSQAGQQANKLRAQSRDTARAWEWIQQNRHRFKGDVYGPPIVECSVKDARFADQLESMCQAADLLAFTTATREDFNMLQEELYGGSLKLADINIRSSHKPLSEYSPPIDEDQARGYGIDAWLLSCISGPEPVLSMLCDNRAIHQIGVCFRDISNDQYEALAQSPVGSFVTPRETYQIQKRYGRSSARVQNIRKARFFTNSAVDHGAEDEQNANIRTLAGELEELKGTLEEKNKKREEAKARARQLQEEEKEIQEEKASRQHLKAQFDALPGKLEVQGTKLAQLNATMSQYSERVAAIAEKGDELVLQKAQLSLDIVSYLDIVRKTHTQLLEAELLRIEAVSELETLRARNIEVQQLLTEKERELSEAERTFRETHDQAKDALAKCRVVLANRTEEEEKIQASLPKDLMPEDLENEIESAKARLEMVHDGNPQIIREFEDRERRIEVLRETVSGLNTAIEAVQGKITEVREKWEPMLDGLVAKISEAFGENFARIGCAGQVTVHKDEEFENWAIQVQVKFRETEQLSILDSHRQSGGERAVSTIFYLMALQSLARAPFRVVDEINQGMDPSNERLVHSRMVEIACATHTSQYFLITPKLLNNLKYHPNMKVHCIASGEYMPSDHRDLDFSVLAARARGLKAGRAMGVAR
ncbi:Structural maintenance of chromosomes protein 5 [Elasticomyces elasticus]|nr:Structural maintenance of chromosomes protein 5 [Elasticomyces elasticus]